MNIVDNNKVMIPIAMNGERFLTSKKHQKLCLSVNKGPGCESVARKYLSFLPFISKRGATPKDFNLL